MASAYQKLPAHTDDGAGDLAAEGTLCSRLTATTLGSITHYPKPDHLKAVTGTGPEVMGKVMRDVRDQVEHRT